MDENIAVGVVLYNPDIDVFLKCIQEIEQQFTRLILVDNNSKNKDEIKNKLNKININYLLLENKKNLGIATALNQLCAQAYKENNKWILLLDQDSIIPPNLLVEYKKICDIEKTGIICPKINDRNINKVKKSKNKITYEKECITSGSLVNLNVWKEIGGFDEKMFIDSVDFEFCHRLINKKYKIIRNNDVILDHQIGDSEIRKFLFLNVLVKNHSFVRKYYISRNIIYVPRKEKKIWSIILSYLKVLKLVLIVAIYEKDKIKKIKYIFMGAVDGNNIKIS